MTSTEIAPSINLALAVLASYRHLAGADAELKARFDAIDAGGEGITAEEVQQKLDDWQSAIDQGRL